MRYSIDPDIVSRNPGFVRAILVASDVRNDQPDSELAARFSEMLQAALHDGQRTITDDRIIAWESLYRTFPTPKSDRIRPSHATLLRRIKNGGNIPLISPLVAISNTVALEYMVPCGVFDLTRVTGDIHLGFARGDEAFLAFGKDVASPVLSGEIVLKDEGPDTVICRGWNSRGGQHYAVTSDTQRALMDIDCLEEVVPRHVLQAAAETARSLIEAYCNADVRVDYLHASRLELEV